jgi:hypothetical protein
MLLLLFDAVLILLSSNQYYFVYFNSSVWSIPILFNIVYLMLMCFATKKRVLFIPITILTIFLIIFHIGFLFMNWDYEYLDSPKGTETLIIKHRVATLGESNYFYEFYQKCFHGLLINKIAASDLAIMVRDHESYPNAEKALGLDHPNWLNEKKVSFESKDGMKEIILKKQ